MTAVGRARASLSTSRRRPLHSTMDTATSRSMTGVGRARAYASHVAPPSFALHVRLRAVPGRTRPRPPSPPPAIPEVPSAHKLRHSARSRRIHLGLPTHPLEKPGSFALHYGYCDFAQYDGRWQGEGVRVPRRAAVHRPRARPTYRPRSLPRPPPAIPEVPSAHTSSFCAQSQNPSPPANAPPREARVLCTPLWILRLRAV